MEPTLIAVAAGRAVPGESLSGDAWQLDWHERTCRVAVIDGLGHGPEAAAAAQVARAVLAAQPDLSPHDALRACHAAMRATRGAAMWVGAVDPGRGRLVYAGVGNVEARLWQAGHQIHLVAQRGIVGATLPHLRSYECELQADWFLLVYSDGIRDRFTLEEMPMCQRDDLQGVLDRLLSNWSRSNDDALVVGVRGACW